MLKFPAVRFSAGPWRRCNKALTAAVPAFQQLEKRSAVPVLAQFAMISCCTQKSASLHGCRMPGILEKQRLGNDLNEGEEYVL